MSIRKKPPKPRRHSGGGYHPDDWEAVSDGVMYCAPACGRGCTWGEHTSALRHAIVACEQLGDGWVPALTENLGWHCAIRRGSVRISIGQNGYSMLSTEFARVRGVGGIIGEGATPAEALADARAVLERELTWADNQLLTFLEATE
ncbi:MAG: hypothetical protein GY716_15860 [bacterium]|nr:hypothetical protein [bacterium]